MGNKQTKVLKFNTTYGIKELKIQKEYLFMYEYGNLWGIDILDFCTLLNSCKNAKNYQFNNIIVIYNSGLNYKHGNLTNALNYSTKMYLKDTQMEILIDMLEDMNKSNMEHTSSNVEGEN
jgi:hypothetical protein